MVISTSSDKRLSRLKEIMMEYESVIVAFSGGVDSSLLLKVAAETLGDNTMAVTVRSAVNPPGEVDDAEQLAGEIGVQHLVIDFDPLQYEEFVINQPQRCYYCKKIIMSLMTELARELGFRQVLDGVNVDDTGDFRPGIQATRELGVKHPLLEADLTKADIRELSRHLNLSTADKPAAACLASRFPYGTRITGEALEMVAAAEVFMRGKGYNRVRVRYHGDLARIEVPGEDAPGLLADAAEIIAVLKKLGFIYVTMDLQGYRTGSMNEALDDSCFNKIPDQGLIKAYQ